MLLLLLILPLWALGLLFVAGLCFAARLGDDEQARSAAPAAQRARIRPVQHVASGDALRVAAPAMGAERAMAPRPRREIAA
jgi:hypothetical protein